MQEPLLVKSHWLVSHTHLLCCTRDQVVQIINEQNDLARALCNFIAHSFQPLLQTQTAECTNNAYSPATLLPAAHEVSLQLILATTSVHDRSQPAVLVLC